MGVGKLKISKMTIQLDTTNGHNEKVINKFNKVAQNFSDDDLLSIILTQWCDDGDLESITDTLKDLLILNKR